MKAEEKRMFDNLGQKFQQNATVTLRSLSTLLLYVSATGSSQAPIRRGHCLRSDACTQHISTDTSILTTFATGRDKSTK
jgi:hypothetical protein